MPYPKNISKQKLIIVEFFEIIVFEQFAFKYLALTYI